MKKGQKTFDGMKKILSRRVARTTRRITRSFTSFEEWGKLYVALK